MPPVRIHSLVRALAALSISDDDRSDASTEDIVANPVSPSQAQSPPDPFPSPIARPVFSLEDYHGDASVVRRWAKHPQTLERRLRTARYPMFKFPLSHPPLGLHWGVGNEDSFLFLGQCPALVYLPARLISLNPRKNEAGYGEILLEAEMLDDAYYFGMIELFNLTGDNPTLEPVFHAYHNTGDARSFRNCWDCSGHLIRPRKMKPSRFRYGDVVLIECSIRRTGSTDSTPMPDVEPPPQNVILSFNVTLDAFGLIHRATINITLNGDETDAVLSVRDHLTDHWEDWCSTHLRDELLSFLAQGTGGVPL